MPIRVLHIIKSLGRGGAETLLPESLKLHDQKKFEFHYIYFLPWKDQMVGELKEAGGIVTCFEANNNIRLIRRTSDVIKYCQQHQINLIHCHLPWAGFLGRWVHRRTGIPVLYTEHNKQERYHKITYTLNRLTFKYQTAAIAVSEDVKQSILKNIKPKIPIITVVNGVNTLSYQRDEKGGTDIRKLLQISPDALVIGTIAVFRFQKRLVEWLHVFAEVRKKHPEIHGIIVGDGPLKDEILAERDRLGLSKVVHMAGLQTEVRPYLSAMDVYLMTSMFEGLPIALLEAMSMECAIVSTSAGGIGEVIHDGQEGLLTTVEEWDQLPQKIELLMTDSSKLTQLSNNGRNRVKEAFSMQRMVSQLEELYVQYLPTKEQDYVSSLF
jgi:glycosyltransferase involved in cell wall biosynthesis